MPTTDAILVDVFGLPAYDDRVHSHVFRTIKKYSLPIRKCLVMFELQHVCYVVHASMRTARLSAFVRLF